MSATTVLRREHAHILSMIACLRAACAEAGKAGRLDAETFRTGIDFIRGYADAWHHAKEEVHLFPALVAEGMSSESGPIAVMLHEHGTGRNYAKRIASQLDDAISGDDAALSAVIHNTLAYADLLTGHISKENGVLFNMADQILTPETQAALEREYEKAIPPGADANTGARYEEAVAALCRKWDIDPQAAAALGTSFTCG
ncbi:MAG: hemerythrin domain-containing protein [Xanthomonadales bacterium]|nr:hemerythrin domain-containing protein [Xanthomonadales bacterium]